jgi:AN1-type zinc finger protein 1
MSKNQPDDNDSDMFSVGKHCGLVTCNRLDFLPILCNRCSIYYCKEHSNAASHKCEFEIESISSAAISSTKIHDYKCSLAGCGEKEMLEILCESCGQTYCIKHRLPIDHDCSSISGKSNENKESKTSTGLNEFKFEMKQNVSDKNAPLASKLALMKLKQTAIGISGLPKELKFYCYVKYLKPNDTQIELKPFYFSLKWPFGKCLEFVVDKLKIKDKQTAYQLYFNNAIIDLSLTVEDFVKNEPSSQINTLELRKT